MKIIFAGSNFFAAYILQELLKDHDISLVITQPDKKQGRGMKTIFNKVKKLAVENSLDIFQPENINAPESINYLKIFNPDLFIVVAYGQILSQNVFDIFNKMSINLHLSYLPELRGASPVETAILEGKKITGITIQKMALKLDAGDILLQEKIFIDENDTTETLYEKMKDPSKNLLLQVINQIESNTFNLIKQDETKSTYAKKILKKDAEIDWSLSAETIHNKVRALSSKIPPFTSFKKTKLKLHKTEVLKDKEVFQISRVSEAIYLNKTLIVRCGIGFLKLLKVQPENKKVMDTVDFANGQRLKKGNVIKFD